MCASINNKTNYRPGKSFITQNHLLILWEKNTWKKFVTQGKLREFYLGSNVATLIWCLRVNDFNCNRFSDWTKIRPLTAGLLKSLVTTNMATW